MGGGQGARPEGTGRGRFDREVRSRLAVVAGIGVPEELDVFDPEDAGRLERLLPPLGTDVGTGGAHTEIALGGHDQDDTPAGRDRRQNGPTGEDGLIIGGVGVQRHQNRFSLDVPPFALTTSADPRTGYRHADHADRENRAASR